MTPPNEDEDLPDTRTAGCLVACLVGLLFWAALAWVALSGGK
jgi:hypothetical protein